MTTAEAYAACREIARREAKNFYYAFLALPRHKRDAICAVYAFMRHADDISDDESLSLEDRRSRMSAWLAAWHAAAQGGPTTDPVFIALADTQRAFEIPSALLDQLVEGTTMDLQRAGAPDQYDSYATFDDLYRYCYLVASVVGLVCIRIFGYCDPRAEKLAEETGIAFQLTNILRDVREDAELGRVYLPLDDLARFGVTVEQLRSGIEDDAFRKLMGFESARAEAYYQESEPLMKLIDPKSRRSLWALREIYLKLLSRLEAEHFAVLSHRINVPTHTKLALLLRAFLKSPS